MTTAAIVKESVSRSFCSDMPARHAIGWLVPYASNWEASRHFFSPKARETSQRLILEEVIEKVRKLGCDLTADEVTSLFWYIIGQTEGRYGTNLRLEEEASGTWRWSEEGDGSWKEMFQIDLTYPGALPLMKIVAALPYHGISVAATVETKIDEVVYPDDSKHYKAAAETLECLERLGWVEQKKRKFSFRHFCKSDEYGPCTTVNGIVLRLKKNR